ncbi:MAG: ABC transporter substrate-binding protein [Chloroflexi bacterium]|nr:ABC transporter substrate-binding protein [Chloroflexota bacterium]
MAVAFLVACGANPAAAPTAPSASAAAAATPLHIAVATASANQIIWPLAKQAGYFEKYGLDVTLDSINGPANATAALVSGTLDASTIPGQAIAPAQASGEDLVMIAGLVNTTMLRVMALSSINSIDEVKGKTVAVTQIGAPDYWAWRELMARYGWNDSDVTFVNANSIPGQVALLQRGEAQAIAVGAPNDLVAAKAGAHQIMDMTSLNIATQQNGVTVLRGNLAAKRPAMINLVKATVAAIARWRTDAQFSKDFIRTYLKDDDAADIDAIYQAYVPVFPKAPYPSRDGFARVISELAVDNPAVKGLSPDQMMDTSLVKELEDSGFITQLYPA